MLKSYVMMPFQKEQKGKHMQVVEKFKDVLLDSYELNINNQIVHKKDGYLGRFKKGDLVSTFKMNKYGYLGIHVPKQRATVPVAHLILLLNGVVVPVNKVVDHIDGNFLNNDLNNLRIVDQADNCRNSNKPIGITGEKFISINSQGRFKVRLRINGKRICIGTFKTLQEAITARDANIHKQIASGFTSRHCK